jgi:uncharacterized membrane protein
MSLEENLKTTAIYPVDCFTEAWNLIKKDYLLFFAVTTIGIYIGNLTFFIAAGALLCGVFYCFLKRVDGETVEVDDLLKGFRYFWRGLGLTLVFILPTIFVFFAFTVPFFMSLAVSPSLTENELYAWLGGALLLEIGLAVLIACFHTLLTFSFPLIVDRDLTLWQAILTSAKAVWQNLRGIAGLYGIGFLLLLAGLLFFCIGIYLVIPVILAAQTIAYRKIFPARKKFAEPPPPRFYQGL